MTGDTIAQIGIFVFGLSGLFLTQQSNEKWKKYAPILGMCGQPFWYYASWGQWGIFALTFLYTYVWGLGIYNYWIKDD